jgi:hypothetical protein
VSWAGENEVVNCFHWRNSLLLIQTFLTSVCVRSVDPVQVCVQWKVATAYLHDEARLLACQQVNLVEERTIRETAAKLGNSWLPGGGIPS